MEITQFVEIIKRWGLSSRTEIKNMPNMAQRHDISVDIFNGTPIREYGRNKRYQVHKYKILNNGAYYVHHDWYKNQNVMERVAVTWPWYGHDGCSFKSIIQIFIYRVVPKKNRKDFEVNFDMVWYTIQAGKEKLNLIENTKNESRNKILSVFLIKFMASSGSFTQHWLSCKYQGDYLNLSQIHPNL